MSNNNNRSFIVELTADSDIVDSTYELVIIMSHLNHDAKIKVKESKIIEDIEYDGARVYLYLSFGSMISKENAMDILKRRGYCIT